MQMKTNTPSRAVFALLLCAFVGGTGWLPFRHLQALGLHPLWATVFVYVLAVVLVGAIRSSVFSVVARTPSLWALGLSFGAMNASFFWAVSIGDVVRIVLLFNLMPMWTAILARLLLKEALTRQALLPMALALLGAAVVLWPTDLPGPWFTHAPIPSSASDWLGVIGGVAFALNNVLLRRGEQQSEQSQVLAMFCGGVLVAASVALGLARAAYVPWPPAIELPWVLITVVLGFWFLIGNFALQYGASRLPANVTSVVMLSEIVFAASSSALMGASQLSMTTCLGGGLIMLAAWLSARRA
jgi:drug/metabolite transporter (DMT)-like permease